MRLREIATGRWFECDKTIELVGLHDITLGYDNLLRIAREQGAVVAEGIDDPGSLVGEDQP